ncbi:hypothetical protein Dsin_014021 [Dipteronia sinensis]|uniref:Inositol oxygenase n=1 Tax=Dipteronia sinensis TaxID=43782 RepID=A0AAE0AL53_9ROSI|nr:hypothetical protein Dsin_014021 [Dipteronia sinensis]
MTILIDHPQFGGVDEVQEQKVQIDEKTHLLDGGFLVPHTNSFGHTFSNYDLYSKSKVQVDVEKVKPYYLSLIEKYFPVKLNW